MKAAAAALLLLAGCMAPAPPAAVPAGQIDGAVVDQFLNPYPDATVTLVEDGRATMTSRLGGFTFEDVPEGVHTVQFTADNTHFVRQSVAVRADDVARVILQLPRPEEPTPHIAYLRHDGGTDVGLPGSECGSCSWSTQIHEIPDVLELESRWQDNDVTPTRMRVALESSDGRTIARFEGYSPIVGSVDGASLPHDVALRVRFHEANELPATGFAMETLVRLHYE